MIITIDGGDGVGKTTLATALCEKYNFIYIDKPIHYFLEAKVDENDYRYQIASEVQKRAYKSTNSNDFKAWFTMMSLIYLRDNLDKDKNYIIDRGLLSSFIFNGEEATEDIYKLLTKKGVGFDLSIFLDAEIVTRVNRIRRRNPLDEDLNNKEICSLTADKTVEFATKIEIPFIYIKTDYINKDGVLVENTIEETFAECEKALMKNEKFLKAIKNI